MQLPEDPLGGVSPLAIGSRRVCVEPRLVHVDTQREDACEGGVNEKADTVLTAVGITDGLPWQKDWMYAQTGKRPGPTNG